MRTVNETLNLLNEGFYNEKFKKLYSNFEIQPKRYIETINEFAEVFGKDRVISIFSAPGRSEIIGNHTDHQHGKAIGASIDLDVIAIVSLNNTNTINIKSKGYSTDSIDLSECEPIESEKNKSSSLIRGIAAAFKSKGYDIKGFDAYTSSSVLKGSGLSSSAAFETLVGTIINHLFCDCKESAVSVAKIGQYAENVYFGKPCGLLDETSSSVGGFVYIDFEDTDAPVVSKIDFDFYNSGYALCIVDTGGNHSSLTDDYSDIFSELKDLCSFFGSSYLRQIPEEKFLENLSELKDKYSHRAIIRALHVYEENKRVDSAKDALLSGNFDKFLKLIEESGNSSFKFLQNAYSLSDITSQGIPLALNVTERFLKGKGACRVHGGGFAGTIQAFVPLSMAEEYKKYIESIFGEGKCYILIVRPEGGIRL